MSITGGIKFFTKSKCLKKDGSSAVASSGSGADNVISMNRYVRWDSVGSDDLTTETLTITFDSAKTFNRLMIVGMNVKDFKAFYDTNQDFANVTKLDGTAAKIDVTGWGENTAYFEFDEVTADNIVIQMLNTQIADQEKYVTLVAVSSEIGTLEGYPSVRSTSDSNEKRQRTQTNKIITQKGFETFSCRMTMAYTSQADVDIFEDLFESLDPFLVWLCGGKYGSENFSVLLKNWKLEDIYQVQASGRINTNWDSNVYVNAPETNLEMYEEV